MVTYSYLVTNTSTTAGQNLTSVKVTDPMPGLSAITCPRDDARARTVHDLHGDLHHDTGRRRPRQHHATPAPRRGTPPTGPVVTAQSSLTIPGVQSPTIAIVKTGNPTTFSAPGVAITYSYAVTNTGNVTLHAVGVTDPLPGLSAVNCPVTTLAPGASTICTATYTTTQADVDRGGISNTGHGDGYVTDGCRGQRHVVGGRYRQRARPRSRS